MERTMTVEEKIRRAEEIYERRKQGNARNVATVSVNNKKDIRLLRKMLIQIVVCICIYLIIYAIQNNDYIFSKDIMDKAKEILSYDTNFGQIYEDLKNQVMGLINNQKEDKNEENTENNSQDNSENNENQENVNNQEDTNNQVNSENNEAIGGAQENESKENENKQLSQTEQDIINVKNTTTFIKPVQGTISSKYGRRDEATGSVPKNHTGTDIAANMGTKIISATEGEVVLASDQGDYGKHLKIQIGEVSIIYAHCNNLYVKQGDKIVQGQEIAEVGTTGNSTGPHLHFEIRISERTVDPESILEL